MKDKKFCPRCGSERIEYGVLGTTANYYECKNCGYRGPVIIQDGELSEELKERYEKKRKAL